APGTRGRRGADPLQRGVAIHRRARGRRHRRVPRLPAAAHRGGHVTYEQIRYEVRDGVATITLDRPAKLNAFTARMMRELIDAFDRADADDAVRAVIVTGAGRAFCAGADLSSGGDTFDASAVDTVETHRDGGGQVTLRIYESIKPVIAAINGP